MGGAPKIAIPVRYSAVGRIRCRCGVRRTIDDCIVGPQQSHCIVAHIQNRANILNIEPTGCNGCINGDRLRCRATEDVVNFPATDVDRCVGWIVQFNPI